MRARPRVFATMRSVKSIPIAVPVFVGGTEESADENEGVKIRGIPNPKARNAVIKLGSCGVLKKPNQKKEKMRERNPSATGSFGPNRSESFPAMGDIKQVGNAEMQVMRPVCRGE